MDFFKNYFLLLIFWGAKIKKPFRGQSSVPPGGTKKGMYKIWHSFFWAGYAALYLRNWSIGFAALFIAQVHRNDMNLMTTAETVFDDHRSLNSSAQAQHFW